MAKVKTKQINFTLLYGVVYKKKKNTLYIDYGIGIITVIRDVMDDIDLI